MISKFYSAIENSRHHKPARYDVARCVNFIHLMTTTLKLPIMCLLSLAGDKWNIASLAMKIMAQNLNDSYLGQFSTIYQNLRRPCVVEVSRQMPPSTNKVCLRALTKLAQFWKNKTYIYHDQNLKWYLTVAWPSNNKCIDQECKFKI